MTTEFVLAYVPRKMREIKAGDNYAIVFRELVLKNKETIEIDAPGQFYFLVGGFSNQITITSEGGLYDLLSTSINEVAHEHTGKIIIVNRESNHLQLQFIVAIPNH